MNEQVPSKDVSTADRLRGLDFGVCMPPSVIDEAADELDNMAALLRESLHDGDSKCGCAWCDRVRAVLVKQRTTAEPPAGCAQCSNVAPIAKLTVRDGLAVRAGLYAPGLPDGDHDVYPATSSQPPAPVRGVDLVNERDHGYAEGYSDAVRWQPIETAPKNGNFQVCLESCPDLSWPAHSNNGELWSKAHGPLNRMVQGRFTKATHWRPAHSPPTKSAESP